MNYIKQLQQENNRLKETIRGTTNCTNDLLIWVAVSLSITAIGIIGIATFI